MELCGRARGTTYVLGGACTRDGDARIDVPSNRGPPMASSRAHSLAVACAFVSLAASTTLASCGDHAPAHDAATPGAPRARRRSGRRDRTTDRGDARRERPHARRASVRESPRLRGRTPRLRRHACGPEDPERSRRGRLGSRSVRVPRRRRRARHGESEPRASESARPDPRPLQGHGSHLSSARLRSLERDLRAGRPRLDRDRSLDQRRAGPRRARARERTARRASRRRRHLHAQSPRSLRWRGRRRDGGGRSKRTREDHRARGVPRERGERERDGGQRDGPSRLVHVREPLAEGRHRKRRRRARPDDLERHLRAHPTDGHDLAHGPGDARSTGCASSSRWRRTPKRPSEMLFHFPDLHALCASEDAVRMLHNLYTLRGAVVRDARVWSGYLDEAIDLFASNTDVLFVSHHVAGLGQGERPRLPREAARPLSLPPRPDAPPRESGLHDERDRGAVDAAAEPRARVLPSRLLRQRQPRREGRVPALPRLVRRQPGAPRSARRRRTPRSATSSTWAARAR